MDRPEEIVCHRCQQSLGYLQHDQCVYWCSSCKLYSSKGQFEGSLPSSEAQIQAQKELQRFDETYQREIQQFLVAVQGGPLIGMRYFEPQGPGLEVAQLFFVILGFLAAAAALGIFENLILALAILLTTLWYIRRALAQNTLRWDSFQSVKDAYAENRSKLVASLPRHEIRS